MPHKNCQSLKSLTLDMHKDVKSKPAIADSPVAQPPPAAYRAKPAKSEYRRDLPHLQVQDKPLFVTFVTHNRWQLPASIRGLVLKHCLHDHGVKLQVHGIVVMPDHVHMVFTSLNDVKGYPFGLAEIMSGIKGASAHRINKTLKRRGHVWQREYFDHVLQSDEKIRSKVQYICENPVRKGLVRDVDEYPWLWREWVEGHKMCC